MIRITKARGGVGMHDKDMDDFWDIEKLIPKREKKRAGVRFDISGVEISDSAKTPDAENSQLRLSGALSQTDESDEETLICEYAPANSLISRVSVYSRSSAFRYYEDFERTMHKYLRLTVKSAERVPFFSYVPQYSQLSGARMAWYLYWRSGCRRREYIQTDYAYVLLYVFELINFHNPKHPDRIAEELCSLWRAYRREYPQLDRCMPGWVCDYCFIHRQELPYEIVGDFIDEIIPYMPLREFFLGAGEDSADSYARAVVIGASGYNYKKSKYYTAENKKMYDTHVPAAAARAISRTSEKFRDVCVRGERSVIRRDAYAGALCTSSARRVLCIEYVPLYRSGELRAESQFAVKYAENKLRAVLGLRSRLSVVGISAEARKTIDEYFTEQFPEYYDRVGRAPEERELSREYMAFYESDSTGLELSRAANIEAESWATAELMGEAFDDGDENDATSYPAPEQIDVLSFLPLEHELEQSQDEQTLGQEDAEPTAELCSMLDPLSLEVLSLIASKDIKGAKHRASAEGAFLSDICAKINEAALDAIGDILIECVSDEYYILEDYESEVKQWLRI